MSKMEAMMNTANMLEKRSTMFLEQAKADGIITPAEEKFAELIRDEAFAAALNNCGSAEAVKELLDKNGVDFSMEEIHAMLVVVGTLFQKLEENDGELTDEDLEQIAGGWSWGSFFKGLGIGALAAATATLFVATAVCCIFFTGGTATPFIAAGIGAAVGAVAGGITGGLTEF